VLGLAEFGGELKVGEICVGELLVEGGDGG
jgi:hypothetical protein